MNNILKMFALIAILAAPVQVFAAPDGNNNPMPGIDIIIKKDPGSQPVKEITLSEDEIKEYNSMEADDRFVYLSKIVAGMMNEISKGVSPRGGWQGLLQDSLAKNWCDTCKVTAFTVEAKTEDAGYKITFEPKADR